MAELSLKLLGPLSVTLAGQPVTTFRSRKVQGLLIYLVCEWALHGVERQAREGLMHLFWPDIQLKSAQTNLRQALSSLRRAIPAVAGREGHEVPLILADRQTVTLNPAARYQVDVAAFHGGLAGEPALENLAAAVDLYRGDFLQDFFVPDSAPFEEWTGRIRMALRQQLLDILDTLTEAHLAARQFAAARTYAQRQLDFDDLRENAYRQLMIALAGDGQRREALNQFALARRRLDEELGLAPGQTLMATYDQIRAGALTGASAATRAPSVSQVAKPPPFLAPGAADHDESALFVAREAELARLQSNLEAAVAGQGQVAFVSGTAGRGKSALLRAFSQQAQAAYPDLLVAQGLGDAFSGIGDPYLPFRELLAMLTGDVESRWRSGDIGREQAIRLWQAVPHAVSALLEHGPYLIGAFVPGPALLTRAEQFAPAADWLPALQQMLQAGQRGGEGLKQDYFFQQLTNVLAALSEKRPLLLLFDDMQWADAASVSLLFYLGRRLQGRRIMIVCAYRPDELGAERAGGSHPLGKVIAELRRLSGQDLIDLAADKSGDLFVNAFLATQPNKLDKDFRMALTAHTGGHPLFTVELWHALQERGALVKDEDGFWRSATTIDWEALPARVEAVIGERIGRLEEDLREILTIASVEGEQFTVQVIAQMQVVSERQLLRSLSRELEAQHRLVRSEGEQQIGERYLSRYRFAHALFQRYLYNNLSPGESRLLHREMAGVIEALYVDNQEPVLAQLARHYSAAGDKQKAQRYHLLAGQNALDSYAWTEAEFHFRRGLADVAEGRVKADLLYGLAKSLAEPERPKEAARLLQEAIELYWLEEAPPWQTIAFAYNQLAFAVAQSEGVIQGLSVVDEGLAKLTAAPENRGVCRLLVGKCVLNMQAGNAGAAAQAARQAREMAVRLGDIAYQIRATTAFGAWGDTPREEHLEILLATLPFIEEKGPNWKPKLQAFYFAALGILSRNKRDRVGYNKAAADLFRRVGDSTSFPGANLAIDYLTLGQFNEVERLLAERSQAYRAGGDDISWSVTATEETLQSMLHHYRGEWSIALQRLKSPIREAEQRGHLVLSTLADLLLADIVFELGKFADDGDAADWPDAESKLHKLIEGSQLSFEACCYLIRQLAHQGRRQEAEHYAKQLSELELDHDEYHDRDRALAEGALAVARRQWAEALAAYEQADALCHELACIWQRTRLRLDWAEALIGRSSPGDVATARAMLNEALAQFQKMGASGYVAVVKQRLAAL